MPSASADHPVTLDSTARTAVTVGAVAGASGAAAFGGWFVTGDATWVWFLAVAPVSVFIVWACDQLAHWIIEGDDDA